jgi:hypothetical protein
MMLMVMGSRHEFRCARRAIFGLALGYTTYWLFTYHLVLQWLAWSSISLGRNAHGPSIKQVLSQS